MMEQLIASFPQQMSEAIENISTIKFTKKTFSNIAICGMGGSGIGADFVIKFCSQECRVPIISIKSYDIPEWIDENTLVIASSYSGNTDETIQALNQAINKNANIAIVTSGGKLLIMAESMNLDHIKLPNYIPSPRAALGMSIVYQIGLLTKYGTISENSLNALKSATDLIKYDQDEIRNKAEKIAEIIKSMTPLLYTSDSLSPVALRFVQQIHENSKKLCFYNVVPEMCHNEIVGWAQPYENTAVIMFRSKHESRKYSLRLDYIKELVSNYSSTVIEVYAKGKNLIEKSIYLVHLSDWLSYYLAVKNGKDVSEIKSIDRLKEILNQEI